MIVLESRIRNIVQCPGSVKFSNRRKGQTGREVQGPETREWVVTPLDSKCRVASIWGQ